jgi:hypothetical protein
VVDDYGQEFELARYFTITTGDKGDGLGHKTGVVTTRADGLVSVPTKEANSLYDENKDCKIKKSHG